MNKSITMFKKKNNKGENKMKKLLMLFVSLDHDSYHDRWLRPATQRN